MVAMKWSDRVARLPAPDDVLIDDAARAIYMTHWRPPGPKWEAAREEMRDWVRAQARAALAVFCSAMNPSK